MQLFALGVIGDVLAGQRVIAQRIFERVRRLELELGVAPSHYEPGPDRGDARPPPARSRAARADRGRARREAVTGADGDAEGTAGNTYDKYGSTNPVVRRLMGGFLRTLDEPGRAQRRRASLHDVGCGEGVLTMRLGGAGLRVRGTRRLHDVIAEARRRAGGRGARDRVQGDAGRGARARPATRPSWSSAARCSSTCEDPEAALEIARRAWRGPG